MVRWVSKVEFPSRNQFLPEYQPPLHPDFILHFDYYFLLIKLVLERVLSGGHLSVML